MLSNGGRVEIVGAFPTVMEAELAAALLELGINVGVGQRPHWAPRGQVLVGEVRVIVHAIGLRDLGRHPVLGSPWPVARGIRLLQFVWRFSLYDPVRKIAGEAVAV